jgi:hypothetical protein
LYKFILIFENHQSTTNGQTDEDSRKTPEWLEAQQEMLKRIPSVVAILSDIWSYVASKNASELRNVNTSIGTYKVNFLYFFMKIKSFLGISKNGVGNIKSIC